MPMTRPPAPLRGGEKRFFAALPLHQHTRYLFDPVLERDLPDRALKPALRHALQRSQHLRAVRRIGQLERTGGEPDGVVTFSREVGWLARAVQLGVKAGKRLVDSPRQSG